MRYVTADKYAELIGKHRITVMRMLEQGRIPGARKIPYNGDAMRWAIPENAPWPKSKRWEGYNIIDGYLDPDGIDKPEK